MDNPVVAFIYANIRRALPPVYGPDPDNVRLRGLPKDVGNLGADLRERRHGLHPLWPGSTLSVIFTPKRIIWRFARSIVHFSSKWIRVWSVGLTTIMFERASAPPFESGRMW